ncbi:ComEC/Rec2 family competence protein [Nakamurella flavida]
MRVWRSAAPGGSNTTDPDVGRAWRRRLPRDQRPADPDHEDVVAPLDLRSLGPAAAVWAGALLGPSAGMRWWVVPAGAGVLFLVRRSPRRWAWIAVVACLTGSAWVSGLHSDRRAADPVSVAARAGSAAELTVEVTSFPRAVVGGPGGGAEGSDGSAPAAPRWRVTVHALTSQQDGPVDADVQVFATGADWRTVVPGAQLTVRGRLSAGEWAGLPTITLQARGGPDLRRTAPWYQGAAATVRENLRDSASSLPPEAGALLVGLVVGDTSGVEPQLDADAKATGLAHLLAVSGSHFTVVCGAVVLLLRRVGLRTAVVGGAVVTVALVLVVGAQPSVMRAAVMGSIGLVALLLGRGRTALPALCWAVIALLLTDPDLALSAGFALSVLATAGLVLLVPVWTRSLRDRGWPVGWATVLAVPVAAQIVTMPVIVALSGSVSLVSIPANMAVAPVVALALLFGVLCAAVGPWWPDAGVVLAHCAAPLLQWMAFVAHTLARWPDAVLPWPASPGGVAVLTSVTVVLVLVLRNRRIRALAAAVLVGGVSVLLPAQVVEPGWPVAGWVVVACEVGQGDALVLSTGEPGVGVVIDTGPDPILMDGCLDRLGITRVPLAVLTHLHADHVDGLAGVLDGRQVDAVGVGLNRAPAPAWTAIPGTLGPVPLVSLPAGTVWRSGNLTLEVLGPTQPFRGTASDPNNESVVMMATVAGVRILLTGDIEPEAQTVLLDAGADLRADVLKTPHHGSARVTADFLAAVAAPVVLIGVGVDNDYGHPAPSLLDAVAAAGAEVVLRTDLDGDVAVTSQDGHLATAERGAGLQVQG